MHIVVIGSFGSGGDQHYRMHQPTAALAALPGVKVFEVHPDPATATPPPWPPTCSCSP